MLGSGRTVDCEARCHVSRWYAAEPVAYRQISNWRRVPLAHAFRQALQASALGAEAITGELPSALLCLPGGQPSMRQPAANAK